MPPDYPKVPVKRVTGFDTVDPLARLEIEYILPSTDKIVKTAADLLSY